MQKINNIFTPTIILMVISAVFITIIFIGDVFNLSGFLDHLRFDWATIICAFMSAVATISLGVVSLKQNKKLSDLNEKNLITAKINNGYSLIHFRDKQFVEKSGKILKLKLYDTKNIPLKNIKINSIKLQPLSYMYVEKDSPKLTLTDKTQIIDLKFTPINPDNKEDFYFADIEISFPFEQYKNGMYLRLELDIEVTNALGVTTVYKYYLLNKISRKEQEEIILDNYYEFNYCKCIKTSD